MEKKRKSERSFHEIMADLNRNRKYINNKIDTKMLIASRIDDFRKENGLKTKKELADLFEKRPSEISKWLSGTHNFTIDTLIEIAEVLGVDFRSLLTEVKETQARLVRVSIVGMNSQLSWSPQSPFYPNATQPLQQSLVVN